MRPALLHLSALAAGDEDEAGSDLQVEVAGVLELIHVTTLVHDDVIDGADVRRRVQTVNARWDNETAVILGDYLFASAWKVLTSMPDLRPLAIVSATTRLMCEGELLQISRRNDPLLDEPAYLDIIGKKTAELFRAAAYLGALLAGAPDDECETISDCGYRLGMAFQIADDRLDLVGSEEKMGKSLGTDMAQGQLTLPAIHWLDGKAGDQRASALEELGLFGPAQDRGRVAKVLEAAGSLAYAAERARQEVTKALDALSGIRNSAARQSLELLGEYITARTV
jgi:octaprenyl-diphosphate synthase